MMRLVFWCLIGALLYAALRKLAGSSGTGKSSAGGQTGGGQGRVEDMVRCRVCGLNLPKSEALPVGGQWACCTQHAHEAGSGKP